MEVILKCKLDLSSGSDQIFVYRFKDENDSNYQVTAINMFKNGIYP